MRDPVVDPDDPEGRATDRVAFMDFQRNCGFRPFTGLQPTSNLLSLPKLKFTIEGFLRDEAILQQAVYRPTKRPRADEAGSQGQGIHFPSHQAPPQPASEPQLPLEFLAPEIPVTFLCALSWRVMRDPVLDTKNQGLVSWEHGAIADHLAEHGTNPMTGGPLALADLRPDRNLRGAIALWLRKHTRPCPRPPQPEPEEQPDAGAGAAAATAAAAAATVVASAAATAAAVAAAATPPPAVAPVTMAVALGTADGGGLASHPLGSLTPAQIHHRSDVQHACGGATCSTAAPRVPEDGAAGAAMDAGGSVSAALFCGPAGPHNGHASELQHRQHQHHQQQRHQHQHNKNHNNQQRQQYSYHQQQQQQQQHFDLQQQQYQQQQQQQHYQQSPMTSAGTQPPAHYAGNNTASWMLGGPDAIAPATNIVQAMATAWDCSRLQAAWDAAVAPGDGDPPKSTRSPEFTEAQPRASPYECGPGPDAAAGVSGAAAGASPGVAAAAENPAHSTGSGNSGGGSGGGTGSARLKDESVEEATGTVRAQRAGDTATPYAGLQRAPPVPQPQPQPASAPAVHQREHQFQHQHAAPSRPASLAARIAHELESLGASRSHVRRVRLSDGVLPTLPPRSGQPSGPHRSGDRSASRDGTLRHGQGQGQGLCTAEEGGATAGVQAAAVVVSGGVNHQHEPPATESGCRAGRGASRRRSEEGFTAAAASTGQVAVTNAGGAAVSPAVPSGGGVVAPASGLPVGSNSSCEGEDEGEGTATLREHHEVPPLGSGVPYGSVNAIMAPGGVAGDASAEVNACRNAEVKVEVKVEVDAAGRGCSPSHQGDDGDVDSASEDSMEAEDDDYTGVASAFPSTTQPPTPQQAITAEGTAAVAAPSTGVQRYEVDDATRGAAAEHGGAAVPAGIPVAAGMLAAQQGARPFSSASSGGGGGTAEGLPQQKWRRDSGSGLTKSREKAPKSGGDEILAVEAAAAGAAGAAGATAAAAGVSTAAAAGSGAASATGCLGLGADSHAPTNSVGGPVVASAPGNAAAGFVPAAAAAAADAAMPAATPPATPAPGPVAAGVAPAAPAAVGGCGCTAAMSAARSSGADAPQPAAAPSARAAAAAAAPTHAPAEVTASVPPAAPPDAKPGPGPTPRPDRPAAPVKGTHEAEAAARTRTRPGGEAADSTALPRAAAADGWRPCVDKHHDAAATTTTVVAATPPRKREQEPCGAPGSVARSVPGPAAPGAVLGQQAEEPSWPEASLLPGPLTGTVPTAAQGDPVAAQPSQRQAQTGVGADLGHGETSTPAIQAAGAAAETAGGGTLRTCQHSRKVKLKQSSAAEVADLTNSSETGSPAGGRKAAAAPQGGAGGAAVAPAPAPCVKRPAGRKSPKPRLAFATSWSQLLERLQEAAAADPVLAQAPGGVAAAAALGGAANASASAGAGAGPSSGPAAAASLSAAAAAAPEALPVSFIIDLRGATLVAPPAAAKPSAAAKESGAHSSGGSVPSALRISTRGLALHNGTLLLPRGMQLQVAAAGVQLTALTITGPGVRAASDGEEVGLVEVVGPGTNARLERCTISMRPLPHGAAAGGGSSGAADSGSPEEACAAVMVGRGASADLQECTFLAAGRDGLLSWGQGARVTASHCTAQHCRATGFAVVEGGHMGPLLYCKAHKNKLYGFCSEDPSSVLVVGEHCVARRNGEGFAATHGGVATIAGGCVAEECSGPGFGAHEPNSHLTAEDCCVALRCGAGFAATRGGCVDAGNGCVAEMTNGSGGGGGASDGGKGEEVCDGFVANGQRSRLVAGRGCRAADNRKGAGFAARRGGVVQLGPECVARGNRWFGFAAEGTRARLDAGERCVAEANDEGGFAARNGGTLAAAAGCVARLNDNAGFIARHAPAVLTAGPGCVAVGSTGAGGTGFVAQFAGRLEAGEGCIARRNAADGFMVQCRGSSMAAARGCRSEANGSTGFLCMEGARMMVGANSVSTGNSAEGFCALGGVLTVAAGCRSEHNREDGFAVCRILPAQAACGGGGNSSRRSSGAGQAGLLDVSEGGCVSKGNGGSGFCSEDTGCRLKVGPGCTATANGGGAGFHARGGAELTAAAGCVAGSNTGWGYLAEGKRTMLKLWRGFSETEAAVDNVAGATRAQDGGVIDRLEL